MSQGFKPNWPGNRRWLRVSEASELLAVSTREIYYLAKQGELPAVRLGRAVRIPADALEQWIRDKEVVARERTQGHGNKTTEW